MKKNVSEDVKTINNKIEQNKAQYNLDRKTTKVSALSSETLSNYEFWLGSMFYQKKACYKICNNEKIWIFNFRQRM